MIFIDSNEASGKTRAHLISLEAIQNCVYALALAVSISIWFIALRSPLWLDETHSYFEIKAGFSQIWARLGWHIPPLYAYLLWLWTKLAGTSEVALRIPSVLAMLGAAYLLYRAARALFDWDVAASRCDLLRSSHCRLHRH